MVARKSRRVWGVVMLVKEEMYDKVLEVRRVSDRVMSLVIIFL